MTWLMNFFMYSGSLWFINIGNNYFPDMPIEDFEDIYKILQTEKPVYVAVTVDEKGNFRDHGNPLGDWTIDQLKKLPTVLKNGGFDHFIIRRAWSHTK